MRSLRWRNGNETADAQVFGVRFRYSPTCGGDLTCGRCDLRSILAVWVKFSNPMGPLISQGRCLDARVQPCENQNAEHARKCQCDRQRWRQEILEQPSFETCCCEGWRDRQERHERGDVGRTIVFAACRAGRGLLKPLLEKRGLSTVGAKPVPTARNGSGDVAGWVEAVAPVQCPGSLRAACHGVRAKSASFAGS